MLFIFDWLHLIFLSLNNSLTFQLPHCSNATTQWYVVSCRKIRLFLRSSSMETIDYCKDRPLFLFHRILLLVEIDYLTIFKTPFCRILIVIIKNWYSASFFWVFSKKNYIINQLLYLTKKSIQLAIKIWYSASFFWIFSGENLYN